MSLEAQAHLLRFVQEGTIERLGGNKTIPVRARIIVATHVNLEKAVASGTFREDLYYRLRILTLELPALREREGDIEVLANFFLAKFAADQGPCRSAPFQSNVHGRAPATVGQATFVN